tara:strand:- start:1078 stop:1770 length:693 start_codon:yes stop_codon:yes gene_type:complete
MIIGFFGASEVAWFGYPFKCIETKELAFSWNDIVCKYFKAEQYNRAVLQGSTERVLFELKKCKKTLDLAIVNISNFKFTYLPNCDIDFNAGHSANTRAEQIFDCKAIQHGPKFESHRNFSNQFESKEEFITLCNLHKKYLYNSEAQINRQAGALIQIDMWLKTKNIKTIYLADHHNIPPWVTLTAGDIYNNMNILAAKHRKYRNLPNNISIEGQKLIAKWLIKRINDDAP